MFSREWFLYVFGRWLLLSGISGALVQYLFADIFHIKTIPAFLLNQFILACVFWYVDKLIFRGHFKRNIAQFFRFPRIQVPYNFEEQKEKIFEEFYDFKIKIDGNENNPKIWLNEYIDLLHSIENMEYILREKKYPIDEEYDRILKKNTEEGYYSIEKRKFKKQKRGAEMTKRKEFLNRVKERVILGDGAIGTYLVNLGVPVKSCLENANITSPEIVKQLHKEYIEAGAEIIETNTFAANCLKLKKHGLENKVEEINRKGVQIAKEAVKEVQEKLYQEFIEASVEEIEDVYFHSEDIFIAGSIGPLGEGIKPFGSLKIPEAKDYFKEQIEVLIEEGVDILIIETMPTLLQAKIALSVAREITDLPVISELTYRMEDYPVEKLVDSFKELEDIGADVVGLNCSLGPFEILKVVEKIRQYINLPFSVYPNAGYPVYTAERTFFFSSPAYFREYAKKFVNLGVNIIGGCCGTTPKHIEEMGKEVKGEKAKKIEFVKVKERREIKVEEEEKNIFLRKFEKEFSVIVEVTAPHGSDYLKQIDICRELKGYGITNISIVEKPHFKTYMNSTIFGHLIKEKTGLNVFIGINSQNKNRIAIQSEIIGADALGIDGIIVENKGVISPGDYPQESIVNDMNEVDVIQLISNLNKGKDLWGNPISSSTSFTIGTVLNLRYSDMAKELDQLSKKIDAGCHFVITRPVFDVKFLEKMKVPVPLIAGLLLLKNYEEAIFLNNEIPNINMPQDILERMKRAPFPETGKEIAAEILAKIKEKIDGIYIMSSDEKIEIIRDFLKDIQ